jgi:tripartite-type tricarboxylate transporter receptor subunit TctC
MIGQNANILIVSPSKGWRIVQDLVASAKAKPGSINYGSAGVGTATHIAAEKFRVAAGFEAVHVAYKGGAEALADIVAGRIDFYYCPISTALPFIEDKRVLALVASTSTRAPELPDVPTSLDAGYPNSDLTIWYGVFMPSQTARAIVEKFHSTATKVLATPAMQQRLKQLAINPMPMTPADMDIYVTAELSSNERLIRAAGIK